MDKLNGLYKCNNNTIINEIKVDIDKVVANDNMEFNRSLVDEPFIGYKYTDSSRSILLILAKVNDNLNGLIITKNELSGKIETEQCSFTEVKESSRRDVIIKEIADRADVDMSLRHLISDYNSKYPELNITEDDFGYRLAKSPEEACCRFVVIVCPKKEQIVSNFEELSKIADKYNDLINKVYKLKETCKNIDKLLSILTWKQLESVLK